MSILKDDGDYSSRLKHSSPANTLANNLLSRKRKRDSETPSRQDTPQPAPTSTRSLQKSVSKRFIQTSGDKPALLTRRAPTAPNTFSIKSADHEKTHSFRIVSILPRSSLPLTYVDNSNSHSRLFSANLPQLEYENHTAPLVLIVREEKVADTALYTIERVGERAFALSRLVSWLKEVDVEKLPSLEHTTTLQHARSITRQDEATTTDWWQAVAAHHPSESGLDSRKAPRLSICRPDTRHVEPARMLLPEPESAQAEDTLVEGVEGVFGRFITQYLNTLYLSKTPLGFFAKGPLSRIRAVFIGGLVQDSTSSDLVAFLRTMILSSSTADKKYRDKLPELLKELPSRQADLDKSPVAKKKRRKKRLKPDKQGMLQDESDYFARWWFQDESSAPSDESAEQSLRRRSSQLRTRETFMQVILVLELLALEALPDIKAAMEASAKPKAKKADQLTLSLELLLDKLCIWHSLSSVDALVEAPKPDKTVKEGANQLRSFCIEVIIPFYLSRIPEHARTVNKKLGGPSTSSTTASKTKSTSHNKPTDFETKHPSDKKPRRQLQRVATESHQAQSNSTKPARSFTRSATESQVPSIKREDSTISLSSIPTIRRDSQPTANLQKHRLREREVDFGALAAANEAKAKRKQEVEQKLRDAISTLKKPSRAVVSGEFADVLEQRKKIAEARARPPMPKRNVSSATQITATPKQGNKNSTVAATPHHIPGPSFTRPAIPPSSGPSLVPSSTVRPKSLSFAHFPPVNEEDSEEEDLIPATDHRLRHRDALAETPSKPKVNFASFPRSETPDLDDVNEEAERIDTRIRDEESPLRESPSLLKTPMKQTRTYISMTPSKPASTLKLGKAKGKEIVKDVSVKDTSVVTATPIKSASVTVAEGTGKQGTENEGNDIYDMLGWNDDYDD